MRAIVTTIGMLIACLVVLVACWGAMLGTVIRCNIMEGCRGFDGPAGWLFWLAPIIIWGGGSVLLAGLLRDNSGVPTEDEGLALGCFWLPFLGGVVLLVMSW